MRRGRLPTLRLDAQGHDEGCVYCGKQPADRRTVCPTCGYVYVHCQWHKTEAAQAMEGHGLRTHPEKFPREVDAIRRNPNARRLIAEQAKASPELWQKLSAALDRTE